MFRYNGKHPMGAMFDTTMSIASSVINFCMCRAYVRIETACIGHFICSCVLPFSISRGTVSENNSCTSHA